MKSHVLVALVSSALSLALVAGDVQAKRLSSGGMQRSLPTQPAQRPAPAPAPQQTPAQPAAPQQATNPAMAATAPAAAPKRSWLGPVAGLAAGLGLAALASHLGFGAELASFMTLLLIGIAGIVVLRLLMRRFAGAPAQASPRMQYAGQGMSLAQPQPVAPAAAPDHDRFDVAAFEQIAKRVFIRLQAANDARDQDDLRRFTTPEMYAAIQQELLQRQGEQRTDVLQLQAQVIDRSEEDGRQIVSVRFSGLIREKSEAVAEPFDEVWHLLRPADGSRDWAIAGIQALN